MNKWTPEEIRLLKNNYQTKPKKKMYEVLPNIGLGMQLNRKLVN